MLPHTTLRHQTQSQSPCVSLTLGGANTHQQSTGVWQGSPVPQDAGTLALPKHVQKDPLHPWPESKHFASLHSLLSLKARKEGR